VQLAYSTGVGQTSSQWLGDAPRDVLENPAKTSDVKILNAITMSV